jgi:hypothetical protein
LELVSFRYEIEKQVGSHQLVSEKQKKDLQCCKKEEVKDKEVKSGNKQ